jgi:prepilin-type N-terminal cleavage/methylation domain-containing protein
MGTSFFKKSKVSGFTLIELLVVIAIIGVLAGLVVAVTGKVRKQMRIAEAAEAMKSFKTALGTYAMREGYYPGGEDSRNPPKDDPSVLYKALNTGRNRGLEDWPRQKIGKWPGAYLNDPNANYDTPTEDEIGIGNTSPPPMVFLDPWGRPYHYIEFKSSGATELPGGTFKRKGAQDVAIWSDGPDKTNNWGAPESDDVTSWGDK